MKLAFRKYMEFESAKGNKTKLDALRVRVEQYLSTAFKEEGPGSDEEMSE